jgi:hypothetical protein
MYSYDDQGEMRGGGTCIQHMTLLPDRLTLAQPLSWHVLGGTGRLSGKTTRTGRRKADQEKKEKEKKKQKKKGKKQKQMI